MNEEQGFELQLAPVTTLPVKLTPQAIDIIKENIKLCENLVSSVLEKGIDWGTIPGVPTPFLWDPGASKIAGAFNAYPQHKILSKTEEDTLVSFTIETNLVSRQTQQIIGSGLAACSTRETKYKYRWVTREEALHEGISAEEVDKLKRRADKYRIPNPEYGELVNNIARMAAKRSEVDAVESLPGVSSALRKLFAGVQLKGNNHNWNWFWAQLKTIGVTSPKAHEILKVKSIKADWTDQGKTLDEAYQIIKQAVEWEKVGAAAPITSPSKGEKAVGVRTPKPKRDPTTVKSIQDLKDASHALGLTDAEILKEANIHSWTEIVDPKEIYLAILAVRGENV